MPTPTVFISYSHQDEVWKDRLVPHLCALEQAGVGMRVWHDRKIDGGDKWYPEIREAMANAAGAVLLISADFLASAFCVQEEVPALLKRQEEQGMLLIPVLLKPCVWKAHRWLKNRQMLPRDGKCVATDFAGDHADTVFAAVAEQVLHHLERLSVREAALRQLSHELYIPPWSRSKLRSPRNPLWSLLFSSVRTDLIHLPATGRELFGRDEELAFLDSAWVPETDAGASPVRVLAFTAHGGVGKSTLVNHWLEEMERDHYRGATRVFGWSFYSQSVRAGTASADLFIAAALRFFGDSDPTAGSPWEKGERLAGLIGVERALLVLDGMEPLQSTHAFERGKLRDASVEALLCGLARRSSGLCVITTREPLADLAGRAGVLSRDLEQISPEAGRALLRTLRVVGTDAELEALVCRFGPHALEVSLLGVYLREHPGHGIGPAQALEQMPGARPIDRVLAGFEQWLGQSRAREALQLLGFFDRPADAGGLRALRAAPPIAGLTDLVAGLDEAEWYRALDRLEKLRLIHVEGNELDDLCVDTHPLIREHFAELLKGTNAWCEGHRRLYEHLCAATKEGDQPTLEELQPLYHAVAHGCLAGLQQEVGDNVYVARILRGNEKYSIHKLCAFASELGAVSCFFETLWSRVSPKITESGQAFLLNQAAFCLRSCGRLAESLEPMRVGLQMRIEQQNWKQAAINASNLSALELMLGSVTGAEGDAEQSVTYAERGGEAHRTASSHATVADALHQGGRRSDAEVRFREAERMQAESHPGVLLLGSVDGFHYCELLLAEVEIEAWRVIFCRSLELSENGEIHQATLQAVSERAANTLKVAERNNWPVDIALDHLTLGCTALYKAILRTWRGVAPQSPNDPECLNASANLNTAVGLLRHGSRCDFLPLALLSRAWLRFLDGKPTGVGSAKEDLDEAWEIAERGPMRLFMADIHLHRARLFFREKEYPWNKNPDGTTRGPKNDLAAAEKLINACGYHRRDEELADAKRAILGENAK